MTDKPYFVILNTPVTKCGLTPLLDNEELAVFKTHEEAMDAGDANPLGEKFGFEIFRCTL